MTPFERLEAETRDARDYLYSSPILADVAIGSFDLNTYVRFLGNAYHHVKHTVPLMMACGAGLPERLQWMLPLLRDYIDEEIGHEHWILDDLANCGADADAVRHGCPGHEVEVLVSYVHDYIRRHRAVGFFGMVYVLEGTSTELASETARLAQAKLGLPDSAFRYLRSHGTLDLEHVAFFRALINRVSEHEDLDAVIHVANRVYRLYADVLQSAASGSLRHAA